MKFLKTINHTILNILLFSSLCLSEGSSKDIYVSPNGENANDGSSNSPVRDIQVAVNKSNDGSNNTILCYPGTYTIEQTISLTNNLVIKPVSDGDLVIIDGTKEYDDILSVTNAPNEIFLDDKVSILPKGSGTLSVAGDPVGMYETNCLFKKDSFSFESSTNLSSPQTGDEIIINPRYHWCNEIHCITKIDELTKTCHLEKSCKEEIRPGDPYTLNKSKRFLEKEGDWCFDASTKRLEFFGDKIPSEIFIPSVNHLFWGKDISKVVIKDLVLRGSKLSPILLEGCNSCSIESCTIEGGKDWEADGVELVDCKSIIVQNNSIENCSRSGISSTFKTVLSIIPPATKTIISGNNIKNFGIRNYNGAGILINGAGDIINKNKINNGSRMGIAINGILQNITENNISNVCLDSDDCGAIYTNGRDWITARGSKISGNRIENIGNKAFSNLRVWGIYLDDNTTGAEVANNIINSEKTSNYRGGIMLHNGRGNTIKDNNISCPNKENNIEYIQWTSKTDTWKTLNSKIEKAKASVLKNLNKSPDNIQDLFKKDKSLPATSPLTNNISD
jgi:parallel beta-helix repeat protein